MQPPPPRRGRSGQDAEVAPSEAKLDNEEAILDTILGSMVRGALPAGTWEALHAAAQRDDRLSELAFAFERASQDKRLKAAPPVLAADFLYQASRFFGEVFGDDLGAVSYLERALALTPTHVASFERLEELLAKTGQHKKLSELYATAAQHRPRGEQAPLLRRAAELLSTAGGAEERIVEWLQHALRLEPGDERARSRLEALYVKANRLRDVVRLNEQALSAEPPPSRATRRQLLGDIVVLYADKLHEPERAMPHVEQLLALEPTHEDARRVALKLLVVRGLAGRSAAALAAACEADGSPHDAARYLSIELESTRGPKRSALLARLARIKEERLGDDAGAFDALDQAIATDPADDQLRVRYIALADKLGRWNEAAKTFGRVVAASRDPVGRGRASVQLGLSLLRAHDTKRAKSILAGALAITDTPDEAVLAAARALRPIHEAERDLVALCDVLERIVSVEPDARERQDADERLAELAASRNDPTRAIAAYERLLPTSARSRALAGLAPLYEATGAPEKHASVLEEMANDSADPARARAQQMRAAEVRAKDTSDAATAIRACTRVIERFGPARDVLALLVPLLEAQRRWPDLATALLHDAALTTETEHAQIMSRLGILRMQKLRDFEGAITAFDEALAFDPKSRTARSVLERLAAAGEHRLAAARVLEPLYRRERASGMLLRVLELRGSMAPELDDRMAALRESADLAEAAGLSEAGRALEIAGRGLAECVASDRPLAEWIERIDRLPGRAVDPRRRAGVLSKALANRAAISSDLAALTKRAAEAHAAADDAQEALALYRRALAYEPHSTELLSRIDDLLRTQGSPPERVALYRAALASAGPPAQGELLRRIGAIQWHDLGDLPASVATYRQALERDAEDADAYSALAELYGHAKQWDELYALLEKRLAHIDGSAARATRVRLADVASAQGENARARRHCLELLTQTELAPEHLDILQTIAARLDDSDLACILLSRRVEATQDSREQMGWLDQLGHLREKRGDVESAASAWKRAASLAEAAGDDAAARSSFQLARKVAPQDSELTARLASLCERAELWSELPELYSSLAEESADDVERVDFWLRIGRVLADRLGDLEGAARRGALAFTVAPMRADVLALFEKWSIGSGNMDTFERALEAGLQRLGRAQGADADQRALLLLARARVASSAPGREEDAVGTYRTLLNDERIDRAQAASILAAFEALVARDPESPARRADARWLLEWRAEHASDAERVPRLLDWARASELLDPARALLVYRRVLDVEPDTDEALAGVGRLGEVVGDIESALWAVRARRDHAQGTERLAIELELARLLMHHTTRLGEALVAIGAVLADAPSDSTARALAAKLLANPATRAESILLLEQACDATEEPAVRAAILEDLLDAPAAAGDKGERCRWFARLCDLHREEGALLSALSTAVRASREMPEVAALWDRAEEVARLVERGDDVAALYEEVLARPLDREQTLVIGERAVRFYEEWFEDPGRVTRILERVIELDPAADWAFDRLKLLFDASGRWDDLFALYDRALDSAKGTKRVTLLEDAAQIAKDFADRPDHAVRYLEQLLEAQPGDAKLLAALERLYERQGRHRELALLLTGRLPSLRADAARRARSRLAALWLDELGDPATALQVVEPMLDHAEQGDPANGDARDVWPLLERVLAAVPLVPSQHPPPAPAASEVNDGSTTARRDRKSQPPASVRQRVAGWLRHHYAQTGQTAELARILIVELEAATSPEERVRRHLEVAALYEKLDNPGEALEQVGLALAHDPLDPIKRARAAQLAERSGRFARLADLLAAAGEQCLDDEARIELKVQAAALRAERAGDAVGAMALLSSVLAMKRAPVDGILAAARRLEPLLEAAGRSEERLDVIEQIALVEREPSALREALGRGARLAVQLGSDARAISFWQRRLAMDGEDPEAIDELVHIFEREGQHDRLADILLLRARTHRAAGHGRDRADRVRVARLLGDVLARPADAIAVWHEIERDCGEAEDIAVALLPLFRETERWEDLARLLERSSEKTPDAAARAKLLTQLGDVHGERLGSQASAVPFYARALDADPRNARARAALFSLAANELHRDVAVGVLLASARACDDWQEVLHLTEYRLAAPVSDAEKLAVLMEAAEIAERRGSDSTLAFEFVRRAFSIAPGDGRIQSEAARLGAAAGAWGELVEAYRAAVGGPARGDDALVAHLRIATAAALEAHLDDASAALGEYLQVVSDGPDPRLGLQDGFAASAAVRVAARLAKWDVAARVVVDVASRAGGEGRCGELLDVYEQAASAFQAWDRAAPALSEATRSRGITGRVARDLEARVAAWHRDQRDDFVEAEEALKRALVHDEADATLLGQLVQLRRREGGAPLVESLTRLSLARGR